MLDPLKAHTASSGPRETRRLILLGAACIGLGAAFVMTSTCRAVDEARPPVPAAIELGTPPDAPAPVPVVREKVLAPGDGPEAHQDASYARGALEYVLTLTRRPLAEPTRRVEAKDLAALPFAEAAGRLFQTAGRVVDQSSEEFGSGSERLWSQVVEAEDGTRFVVLKHGFSSDQSSGQPRSSDPKQAWIAEGDYESVRGVYLQRRTGTVGKTALTGPTPVLVAQRFRKMTAPLPPIADPSQANWDGVSDRFLGDTKRWEEPALFQMLRWATVRGAPAIREDIATGRLAWKPWERPEFDQWNREIRVETENEPRPFTEGARGKLWRLDGAIGEFLHESWDSIPDNPPGADELYFLDMVSEDYSVKGLPIALRLFVPFPLQDFPGVQGFKTERVYVYGYFLKNFTYATKYQAESHKGNAETTVPTFVVVHMEPVPPPPKSDVLWWLAGSMVFVGILFYVVLIRGERKEAKRHEEYRLELRKRMRAAGQLPGPGPGGGPPPPDAPKAGG